MSNPLPVIPGRLPAAPDKYDRDNEAMTRRIIELALARGPTSNDPDVTDPSEGIATVMNAHDFPGGSSAAGITLFIDGSVRSSTTAGIFFTSVTGGGHPFTVHGGVTVSVRKTSVSDGASCVIPEWPVFSNWSDLGEVASQILTPLKYVYECVFMRHDTGAEIGIKNKPNELGDAGTTPTGYILYDNAGVWQPRRRLTAAGAVENLDALVEMTSDVARKLQIVFEEGETPLLTFIVDGEIIYQTSGIANMPEQPATSTVNYGPTVTGDILTTRNRILIEEVA